jgi:hypothetical protein
LSMFFAQFFFFAISDFDLVLLFLIFFHSIHIQSVQNALFCIWFRHSAHPIYVESYLHLIHVPRVFRLLYKNEIILMIVSQISHESLSLPCICPLWSISFLVWIMVSDFFCGSWPRISCLDFYASVSVKKIAKSLFIYMYEMICAWWIPIKQSNPRKKLNAHAESSMNNAFFLMCEAEEYIHSFKKPSFHFTSWVQPLCGGNKAGSTLIVAR